MFFSRKDTIYSPPRQTKPAKKPNKSTNYLKMTIIFAFIGDLAKCKKHAKTNE